LHVERRCGAGGVQRCGGLHGAAGVAWCLCGVVGEASQGQASPSDDVPRRVRGRRRRRKGKEKVTISAHAPRAVSPLSCPTSSFSHLVPRQQPSAVRDNNPCDVLRRAENMENRSPGRRLWLGCIGALCRHVCGSASRGTRLSWLNGRLCQGSY